LQVVAVHEFITEAGPVASVSPNANGANVVQVSDVSHTGVFTSADVAADASIAESAPTTHLNTTQAGAQITRGNYHWGSTLGASPGSITFGFRTSAPSYTETGEDLPGTFSAFTAQEQATARAALALWASVANITFTDLGNTNNATIEFANYYSSTDGAQAFAYFPGRTAATAYEGDVFMNTAYVNTTSLGPGTYDWMTLIHEIGHALGLQHPGDYNAGTGTITYNNSASYVEDTRQYSLMSYFAPSFTGGSFSVYNETPMIDDIAAIQRLYGANTSTFSGNTVFGFNSNAGTPYSITSSSQKVAYTVYDTGGNDTLDFSGYTQAQTINLNAESFSSVGGDTYNVSIAQNVTIENAIGGSGADTIIGNAANNTIRGGAGVDTLTGGGGVDTFVFTAGTSSATTGQHDRITDFTPGTDKIDLSGYDAVPSTSGIVDLFNFLATAAFNGVAGVLDYFYDSVRGVTVVQGDTNGDRSADFAIDLAGNLTLTYNDFVGVYLPTVVVETNGSTKLTQVGSVYYLYNSGGTGPSLKYGGVDVVAGQFGDWLPVSAEVVTGGYAVVLKQSSTGQFSIWGADSSGNYNANMFGAVTGANLSGTSYTLETFEPTFQQDLNGDGTIGNVLPTSTVESSGSTTFINAGNHYYFAMGGTGISLKYGNADVVAGQFGSWLPVAAEAITGGYEIAFKLTGSNQFSIWGADAAGNYNTQLLGSVSGANLAGNSATLESFENSFHQDLNGDGIIGLVTNVVESSGSTSLNETGGHYYLGGAGPSLKYGGADVVSGQFGSWLPVAVEAVTGGYEVAFKLTGSNQFSIWGTDASGNYNASILGAVTGANLAGNSATLESFETSFHQDLNGDGTIGLVTNTVEANGSTSLNETGGHYYLGGAGPSLKYGGADVVSGQFGAWLPVAVEAVTGGYEVAFKLTGSNQFSIWGTDTNGNYNTSILGAVSGSNLSGDSYILQSFETSFNQDLNGDGTTGNVLATTTVESSGSTTLINAANHYYFGNTGPSLKYGGADVVAGQFGSWLPIAVEAISGGYEVAFKLTGSNQFSIWGADANGNYTTQLLGSVTGTNLSGTSSTLKSFEASFQQDLNGDGVISSASPASGAATTTTNSIMTMSADSFIFATQGVLESRTHLNFDENAAQPDHAIASASFGVADHTFAFEGAAELHNALAIQPHHDGIFIA
jgi:serralysin